MRAPFRKKQHVVIDSFGEKQHVVFCSMKSLHAFMQAKQLSCSLRLDINPPSSQVVDVKTTTGESVNYRLISLPLYMSKAYLVPWVQT
jgi:hypothetical protein